MDLAISDKGRVTWMMGFRSPAATIARTASCSSGIHPFEPMMFCSKVQIYRMSVDGSKPAVADLPARDIRAEFDEFASKIAAGRHRQGRLQARTSGNDHGVESVE